MSLGNKSKLEETKNICGSIKNSELRPKNQVTKSDMFETFETGIDAIDNSETKENMFSCYDEEDSFEEITENVGKQNIKALEEKFKDDTFPSTVIRPVKQNNGHCKMEITEVGRESCADSVVRFGANKSKVLKK